MRGRPRSRRFRGGDWRVRARVERFIEPSVLLLLRERPMHGYELLDRAADVARVDVVDVGNLYRLMRTLEEEGIVTSEWSADLPGPAKRTYALTDAGRRLLDGWADALRDARGDIDAFLQRYEEGR